jgi:hypothetical protein
MNRCQIEHRLTLYLIISHLDIMKEEGVKDHKCQGKI